VETGGGGGDDRKGEVQPTIGVCGSGGDSDVRGRRSFAECIPLKDGSKFPKEICVCGQIRRRV
jgi:hypothetical protein